MEQSIVFPAEWYPQSAVQLTWPHEDTDWAYMLNEAVHCFADIARAIVRYEPLIIVCRDRQRVVQQLGDADLSRIRFCEVRSNDTWARDHGGISIFRHHHPEVYDFVFNGWGMKFPANYDNLITRELFRMAAFRDEVQFNSRLPFVLEGGSIESNGAGVLLTTSSCLLSQNRNEYLDRSQIEAYLKRCFGLTQVLWLDHGYLEGDDTDGHIDTLARFCNPSTIAYVHCDDPDRAEYAELQRMQSQLRTFRQPDGSPYRLIALPMADRAEEEGRLLPATYANFLILNGAVLVPFYHTQRDGEAKAILQSAFPDREVIGVDCRALIRQNGSLHCVTMQYPSLFV